MSSPTMAEDKEVFMLCRIQKIVRTLQIKKIKTDNEVAEQMTCRTLYTKGGVERVVGKSKNYSGSMSVLDNVRGNLEEAGWKCKEISRYSIIASR